MKKVIIIGKSGSGKDYLEKNLVSKGFVKCVKWTDRPQRKNEVQDKTYHFVDNMDDVTLYNDIFILKQSFKVKDGKIWSYGIPLENFINSTIIQMTPHEYNYIKYHGNIKDEVFFNRLDYYVIYLDIDRDTREKRLLQRGDTNDDIKRRLDTDDMDFKNLCDIDLWITDSSFTIEDIYDKICKTKTYKEMIEGIA